MNEMLIYIITRSFVVLVGVLTFHLLFTKWKQNENNREIRIKAYQDYLTAILNSVSQEEKNRSRINVFLSSPQSVLISLKEFEASGGTISTDENKKRFLRLFDSMRMDVQNEFVSYSNLLNDILCETAEKSPQ